MSKAQMHFEVDYELKAHWKAFFALLPRKSETRILTELMRNFLEKAKANYKKEAQDDPGANEVDQPGNREGVHDESGVEVPGSNARLYREIGPIPEDPGTQS